MREKDVSRVPLFAQALTPNSVTIVVTPAQADVRGFIKPVKARAKVIAFESDKRTCSCVDQVRVVGFCKQKPVAQKSRGRTHGPCSCSLEISHRLVKPFLTYMESEECQEVKEQLQLEDSSQVPETVKCSSCAKPILEDPILCAMCPLTVCHPCDKAVKEAAKHNPVDAFFCGDDHAAAHKASAGAEEATEVTQPTPQEQEDAALTDNNESAFAG
jgi:hypothetical protein